MLIDWFTVAAQVANFLILLWLLKRFMYKPVLAAIAEREKRISTQIQEAANIKAQATKEQAEYQRKNAELEDRRATLLAEATISAAAAKQGLLEASRKEAEALGSRLRQAMENQFERLSENVASLVQKEIFAGTRKVLLDLGDISVEERITTTFIARLQHLREDKIAELKAIFSASERAVVVRSGYELQPAQKAAIEGVLNPFLPSQNRTLAFEVRPEVICGIEVVGGGQKLSWNIADYLDSFTGAIAQTLAPQADVPPTSTLPAHAT